MGAFLPGRAVYYVYTRPVLQTGNTNWYQVPGTREILQFKMVPGTCFGSCKLVLVPFLDYYCIFKLVLVPVLNYYRILKLLLVPILNNF